MFSWDPELPGMAITSNTRLGISARQVLQGTDIYQSLAPNDMLRVPKGKSLSASPIPTPTQCLEHKKGSRKARMALKSMPASRVLKAIENDP